MGDQKLLAPDDPAALKVLFRAKYGGTAPDTARTINEIYHFVETYRKGTTDSAGLRNEVLDMRNYINAKLQGKSEGLDVLNLVLAGAKAAAEFSGSDLAKGSVGFVQDVISLPPLSEMINDHRSHNAAEATGDLIAQFNTNLDSAVDYLIQSGVLADPRASQALGGVYPELLGPGQPAIDPSPGECIKNHPEVFSTNIVVNVDNSAVIQDVKQLRVDVKSGFADITAQFNTGFATLTPQIAGILDTQDSLLEGEDTIIGMLTQQKIDASKKEIIEAQRKAAADQMTAIWEAASGSVRGLSALASLVDPKLGPKLGEEVSRVGGTLIQTAQSAVTFVNAVSAVSEGLTALSALGTAAATGNIIGAVVGLFSIFSPAAPSPELLMDQKILNEIGKVQKSLDNLGKEMTRGFNRIDQQLQAIYEATMQGFSRLADLVGKTYDQVLEVRKEIVKQQAALFGLRQSLSAYMQSIERLNLYTDINAGIDYAARNAEPMPPDLFNEFAATYYTWAKQACFDDINQPVAGRSTDDADLAKELRSLPVGDNASYLNNVLSSLGVPGLTPVAGDDMAHSLPNSEIWGLACSALAELYAQWPKYADKTGYATWLADTTGIGYQYVEAITSAGKDISAASRLIDMYKEAMKEWGDAIDTSRPDFETHILPEQFGHDPGRVIDILARTDQVVNLTLPLQWDGHFWHDRWADGSTTSEPPVMDASYGNLKLDTRTLPPAVSPTSPISDIPVSAYLHWCGRGRPLWDDKTDWYFAEQLRNESIQNMLLAPGMLLVHYLSSPGTSPLQLTWRVDALARHRTKMFRDPDTHKLEPQDVTYTVDMSLTLTARWRGTVFASAAYHLGDIIPKPFFDESQLIQEFKDTYQGMCPAVTVTHHGPDSSAIIADAATTAQTALRDARTRYFNHVAAQSTAGGDAAMLMPAETANGRRWLIEAYVSLVWPQARGGDDVLRALLDGPSPPTGARLTDRDDALLALSAAMASLPAGAHPVRDWLMSLIATPSELLRQRLGQWAGALAAGTAANDLGFTSLSLSRAALAPEIVSMDRSAVDT